jgi:hypothetical protein
LHALVQQQQLLDNYSNPDSWEIGLGLVLLLRHYYWVLLDYIVAVVVMDLNLNLDFPMQQRRLMKTHYQAKIAYCCWRWRS